MAGAQDEKFDRILKRMLETPPLSKAEISARIKRERGKQLAAEMREKTKRFQDSKQPGQ